MNINEDTLLAYADGELDAATRAQVEAAIAADPALARRVQQHQALRGMLSAAYDPVLDEPIPSRLLAAAQAPAQGAAVVDLASERAARKPATLRRSWSWTEWGAMAACLMVGLFAGRGLLLSPPGEDIVNRGGQWVAGGSLAQSLSSQLASVEPADAPVKIGLSFLSRGNEYCRTFLLRSDNTAGLACRQGDGWRLRVLAQDGAPAGDASRMRMAASPLPAAVLRAVDEQMQGAPLDAEGERAALQRGWRAP